jgi:hypothetical protein
MIRFLSLSASTLALIIPVAALAIPVGGLPVYRATARTPSSVPASLPRTGSAAQQPFRVPSELNAFPRTQWLDPQATWSSFRPWEWRPGPAAFLYQPVWYQTGCNANAGFAEQGFSLGTPIDASAPETNVTFGSLVDGQPSKLFGSSPSDVARVASSGDAGSAVSPLTLQYGVGATPCGSTNPFAF